MYLDTYERLPSHSSKRQTGLLLQTFILQLITKTTKNNNNHNNKPVINISIL